MALVTYTDLVNTVALWLNRSDLSAQIPDFIRLAEARMQRDLHAFATRVTGAAFPVSATTAQTLSLVTDGSPVEITSCGWRAYDAALAFNPETPIPQVSQAQLLAWHDENPATGAPEAYAVIGQVAMVYPFPNVPKTAAGVDTFYQLIMSMIGPTAGFAVPITAGNYTFNPIWREHPDLYLYGALAEAAPYLQHDERVPIWEARFRSIVRDIRIQDERLAVGTRPQFQPLARVF